MADIQLTKRALGDTGLMVSPLGIGTVKFGRTEQVKYPSAFDLPDEKFLANFLAQARDFGVNLVDTAPSYGIAEERLGRLLHGQRAEWVIAGKAGEEFKNGQSYYDFSAVGVTASLERSLQRLQTDYLDLLLLHATQGDAELLKDDALWTALQQAKQAGKIRAVGISTYSVEAGLAATEICDVLMVSYNSAYVAEAPVIAKAAAHNVGIIVKKALNSGHAANPATALQFVFDNPGVTAAIVGTINADHLAQNVHAVPH